MNINRHKNARITAKSGKKRQFFSATHSLLGLIIATTLALLAEYVPPYFGMQPFSFMWAFPAAFSALVIIFGATIFAARLEGLALSLFQILLCVIVLVGYLAIFKILGGDVPPFDEWWRLTLARSEALTLIIAAGVITLLLGGFSDQKYPFRAAIIAATLVFLAVWMDFQGYYTVDQEGYDWLLGVSEFKTERFAESVAEDNGSAFTLMFFATLSAWAALLAWWIFRKTRAS